MAGGIFFVSTATHTVAKGVGIAIRLAGTSSSAFIGELAKLDVVVELGGRSAAEVLSGLRALELQLAKSRNQAVEEEGGYRGTRALRSLGEKVRNPVKITELPSDIKHELKRSEATNLAAAQRAVEYEIRHLTSEPWKRVVQKGTRFLSMPGLSKPLDRL